MAQRQQILYLWLAEGAMDTGVIAWAFHDGTQGKGAGIPDDEPPYKTGVHALRDGWMLFQSPPAPPIIQGQEYETSYLPNEFVFERRFEVSD
jgi:hypothetical protein